MAVSVILTGVTGFLAKVVLEELLRRQQELGIHEITVLVRPKRLTSAKQRFQTEVSRSPCFSHLQRSWESSVHVVACDLRKPRCGVDTVIYTRLCTETTHIIHCAGSVAFSSAMETLLADNVTSSLNILELGRACMHLQRLVTTSTAYVTPFSSSLITEVLPSLPKSASYLYELLRDSTMGVDDVLELTDHPNLYTLSKCLTEQLLVERMGDVLLVIARPSIISASWRYPAPGWIDSFAAFAGLVAAGGTGVLRVLNADKETVMDIVPVDDVARRLIEEALIPPKHSCRLRIVHIIATVENGIKISTAHSVVMSHFRQAPVLYKPKVKLTGSTNSLCFRYYDAVHHRFRLWLFKMVAIAGRDDRGIRRIHQARKAQVAANTLFEPFTHNTYDFRSEMRSLADDFECETYLHKICHGVRAHLLEKARTSRERASQHESERVGGVHGITEPDSDGVAR